jgi:ATP-dependent Clp protease ATP-binding subunit ClpA
MEVIPMVNKRNREQVEKLDPSRQAESVREFASALRKKFVGQEEAVRSMVEVLQVHTAGLCATSRPVANFLFLGPTGCGKTRLVEAAAEILFGRSSAVIKIDCAEFQHDHDIAKLIGSPPGYLGHRDTHPLITQEALDALHTQDLKLSFLLFDEIEKASETLWQLLLGILDKATLTLGDNRTVDFSKTVIFMTSNLGGRAITEKLCGGYGFTPEANREDACLDQKIEQTALDAARKRFSPEFINRIDRIIVFRPLTSDQLDEVLNLELGGVQQRLNQSSKKSFPIQVSDSGRQFLLREGTDQRYGARHLKRAIERRLVCPLASLISTDQVEKDQRISIDWDGCSTHLEFCRSMAVSVPSQAVGAAATK